MTEKERLDIVLVKKNMAKSRELAKAYIMAGNVYVDGVKEEKAGTKVAVTADIVVKQNKMKYVSRGGYKLEKAINEFNICLENTVCLDIGASTGGFTDCMLQNGAVKVYSIDVGHGQLDWKLRNDERVICMEKTNFRFMMPSDVSESPDFASVDVSFISLTKILLPARAILKEKGEMVCLIKPQFEAGREKVGKKGVVRDRETHLEVIDQVISYACSVGYRILDLDFSPVRGPEGNIEYLLYLQKAGAGEEVLGCPDGISPADIVSEAHRTLNS